MSDRPRMAAGDWRQIRDDREKYKAYLCSRDWALLRNAVRARCGGKCERCGVNDMECVHHLTYARKYDERIEDLAGWCNACHEFTHGKSDKDPAAAQSKPTTWGQLAEAIVSGNWHDHMDQDGFNRFFEGEVTRSCDCGRCLGSNSWSKMLLVYALASEVIQRMGLRWLVRAAEGDFASNDTSTDDLQKLIAARRQEQGIQ